MVKYLMIALLGALWLVGSVPQASAYVCARGLYRAGCVGPRGGVVVRRPVYGGVVVRRPIYGYGAAYVRRPIYGARWR
jgi:hypothetical protein